jgi:hypothetical protein
LQDAEVAAPEKVLGVATLHGMDRNQEQNSLTKALLDEIGEMNDAESASTDCGGSDVRCSDSVNSDTPPGSTINAMHCDVSQTLLEHRLDVCEQNAKINEPFESKIVFDPFAQTRARENAR